MRSSVPLGHKLIAVVVAVGTACGSYAFLRYREAQLASAASLSFNSAEAEHLDPGITRAHHPAVVLAQSILSDSFVVALVSKAHFAASPGALAIGEFRTHLELTQPTAGLLLVRYRDPDPGQAAAIANAVVKALAAWAPSTTGALPSAVNAQSASVPEPAAAVQQQAPIAEPSLAAALGELQAQLSAAEKRVGPESPLRSEHDRQRYLESQVRAAQQKLGNLRVEFTQSSSTSGGEARLAAIQQALAHFWPSVAGFNTAGTSEAQFSYEREQLIRDIGVVEQQHQAAQREETANPVPANPPSNQAVPPAPQPQPAPADDVPSPPDAGATSNPLHLERMAGLPDQVAWWPSALIGCLGGLLYWGLAFARYHYSSEPDDLLDSSEEIAAPPFCLIKTVASMPAGSPSEQADTNPVETSSRRRACFTFDPVSTPASVQDQSEPPEPSRDSTADTVLESPLETATAPAHADAAEASTAADAVAPVRAPKEQDEVFHEKIAEEADPWGDEIRKNLARTSIGRMLKS